ncbi:MAG: hypothetical protein WD648_13980 [Planctomycetaceae bacterium]
MALDVYKDWLGIPDGPRPPDHYQLLRLVRFQDDAQKIQSNYRKLNAHVRKYASGQYSVQSQELLNELAKVMLCLTDAERKRAYDESLGREFDEPVSSFGPIPIEDVLVKDKHLTREQAKQAQSFAEARGLSMRDAVVQMKLVDADTAAKALAVSLRLPYVDLTETMPDDSVLDQLPRKVARRYSIIPLFVDDGMVLVAGLDEPTHELLEELQLRFGMPAKAVIATPLAINQSISKYYAPAAREDAKTPVPAKSKGTKTVAGNQDKPKEPGPRKIVSELSRQASAEAGIVDMLTLIVVWVTIIALLVVPWFFPRWNTWLFYWTGIVAFPAVAYYVYKVYWK